MPGKSSIRPQGWSVKNAQGKVLGHVKSLTIQPSSEEVVFATLILRHTGLQIRLPRDRFVIRGDQLVITSLDESTAILPTLAKENICL